MQLFDLVNYASLSTHKFWTLEIGQWRPSYQMAVGASRTL